MAPMKVETKPMVVLLVQHIAEFKKLRQEQLNRRGLSKETQQEPQTHHNLHSSSPPSVRGRDKRSEPDDRSEDRTSTARLSPSLSSLPSVRSWSRASEDDESSTRIRGKEPSGKLSLAAMLGTTASDGGPSRDADGVVLCDDDDHDINLVPATVSLSLDGDGMATTEPSRTGNFHDTNVLYDNDTDLVDVPLYSDEGTSRNHASSVLTPQHVREPNNVPQRRSCEALADLQQAAMMYKLRSFDESDGIARTLIDTSLLSITPEKQSPNKNPDNYSVSTPLRVFEEWTERNSSMEATSSSHRKADPSARRAFSLPHPASKILPDPPHPKDDIDGLFDGQGTAINDRSPARLAEITVSPITPGNIPPPETLWERNKTLVKEVRFADQTCVELSARNYALEQQVQFQQSQIEQYLKLLTDKINFQDVLQPSSHSELSMAGTADSIVPPPKSSQELAATKVTKEAGLQHLSASPSTKHGDTKCITVESKAPLGSERKWGENEDSGDPFSAELQKKVSQLEDECTALKASVDELGTEKMELEAKLEAQSDAARDTLESERKAWQARVAEAEATNAKNLEALQAGEHQLQLITSQKDRLSQQVKEMESDAERSQLWRGRVGEMESLNLELAHSREMLEQLLARTNAELEESKATMQKASEQCSVLQERVSELESLSRDQSFAASVRKQQLDDALAAKEVLEQENSRVETRVIELTNRVAELDQICQERSKSLEVQKQELKSAIQDRVVVESDLDIARGMIQKLEQELAASKQSHAATVSRCKEFEDDIAVLRKECMAANSDKTHLQEQLHLVEVNLNRAHLQLTETTASFASREAEYETKLTQAQTSLANLEWEAEEAVSCVSTMLRSAVLRMEREADKLDNSVTESLSELVRRMVDLEKDVHYIKESTDFQVESEKVDDASLDRELSTLTGNSSRERAGSRDELPVETADELMNATFDSLNDKGNDLELMEEARIDRSTPDDSGMGSNAVSDVTDDHDSLSSIEGLSHLFAPSNGIDLSLSVSQSADMAPTDLRHESSSSLNARLPEPDQTLHGEIVQLRNELADIKIKVSNVSTERDNLRRLADMLASEKRQLEQDLKANEMEAESQIAKLAEATSCLALVREERDVLQCRLQEVSSIPQKPVGNVPGAEDLPNNSERCDNCQLLRDQLGSLERMREAVIIDRDTLLDQVKSLRLQKDDITKDLREASNLLKRQSEDYANELSGHRMRCNELQEAVEATQLSATQFREERDKVMDEMDVLKVKLADVSAERLDLQRQLDSCRGELEEAVLLRVSAEEKAQFEARHCQQLNEEHERWRSELTSLNTKYIATSKQVETLQLEVHALVKDKEDVSSELGAMLSRNEKLESDCGRLEEELASTTKQRDSLLSELEALNQRISAMGGERDCIKSALEEARASLSVKDAELNRASDLMNTLQRKSDDLEKRLTSLQAELKEKNELCDRLTKSKDHITKSLSNLKLEMENLESNKRLLETELEGKILELDESYEQCGRLRASSEQASEDLRRLEITLAQCNKEQRELEQSLLEYQKRILSLENSKAEVEAELVKHKDTLRAAEEYASHTEGLAAHAEKRWIELQNELSVVRKDRDEGMAKYLALEQRHQQANDDKQQLRSRLEDKENQLLGSQETIHSLEAQLVQCRDDLEAARSNLKQMSESRDTANESLTLQVAEADKLRRQMQEMSESLDSCKRELVELETMTQRKDDVIASLVTSKGKLESKCSGLRQYVEKLMFKCGEWESYCTDQAQALLKLKASHEQMQRMLLERDQVYNTERVLWTTERTTLAVKHHTLEEELDELARELLNCSTSKA